MSVGIVPNLNSTPKDKGWEGRGEGIGGNGDGGLLLKISKSRPGHLRPEAYVPFQGHT